MYIKNNKKSWLFFTALLAIPCTASAHMGSLDGLVLIPIFYGFVMASVAFFFPWLFLSIRYIRSGDKNVTSFMFILYIFLSSILMFCGLVLSFLLTSWLRYALILLSGVIFFISLETIVLKLKGGRESGK